MRALRQGIRAKQRLIEKVEAVGVDDTLRHVTLKACLRHDGPERAQATSGVRPGFANSLLEGLIPLKNLGHGLMCT
jgi:hypothetical protein